MNSSPASQPKHASRQLGICAKPSSNALKISPRRAAPEARQCQMAPGPARSPALSPEQLLHQASPPSPEREEVKGRIFEDRTMEMAWKLDLVGKDGRCVPTEMSQDPRLRVIHRRCCRHHLASPFIHFLFPTPSSKRNLASRKVHMLSLQLRPPNSLTSQM